MPAVSAPSRRDPAAARRLWAERLDRFRRANQTVAQFCAAEGISEPSFYVWKRTLAGEVASPEPITPALVPIRLTPSPVGGPAGSVGRGPTSHVEVVLPSGTLLRFPPDARPEVIAAVVHAVEGRPC
jgi:transposase